MDVKERKRKMNLEQRKLLDQLAKDKGISPEKFANFAILHYLENHGGPKAIIAPQKKYLVKTMIGEDYHERLTSLKWKTRQGIEKMCEIAIQNFIENTEKMLDEKE